MDKHIRFRRINDGVSGYTTYSVPGEIIDTGKAERYYLVVTEDGELTWVYSSVIDGKYLESDPMFDEDGV